MVPACRRGGAAATTGNPVCLERDWRVDHGRGGNGSRYWVRHLRETVRFADGLGVLLAGSPCSLLEVGPGRTLTRLARQHPDDDDRVGPGDSLPSGPRRAGRGRPPPHAGAPLAGGRARGVVRRTRRTAAPRRPPHVSVRAPTPLDRTARTGPAADVATPRSRSTGARPTGSMCPPGSALSRQARVASSAQWRRSNRVAPVARRPPDRGRVGDQIAERGDAVVRIEPGDHFAQLGPGHYVVYPRRTSDYGAVLHDLARSGQSDRGVVHAWNLAPAEAHAEIAADRGAEVAMGFHSLVALAQALGRRGSPPTRSGSRSWQRVSTRSPATNHCRRFERPCWGLARSFPKSIPPSRAAIVDVAFPNREARASQPSSIISSPSSSPEAVGARRCVPRIPPVGRGFRASRNPVA